MKKGIRAILVLLSILVIGGIFMFSKYKSAAVSSNLENYIVEIPTNAEYDEVVAILKEMGLIEDVQLFTQLAEKMNYKRSPMRSGRYEIKPGWSVIDMIRHLRNGKQAPVNVVINIARLPEEVAEKIATFIEPDAAELKALFADKVYLKEIGFSEETLMSLFIPNTYQLYWNSSPSKFMERMLKEHKNFWSKDKRKIKAKALKLTPAEVYTLASIVERETLQDSEKKRMAGVYLNRIEKGMLLQADPTSVFARRDFTAKRVTDYHTKFDSPYNTYMYTGLPPGPISMANISSIDAVLNAEDHKYVYFCAKGDGSGFHNFAKNLTAHNRNAQTYRANLKKRKD